MELRRVPVFDVLPLVVAGAREHLHGSQRGHYDGAAGLAGHVRKVLSSLLGCNVHGAAGVYPCMHVCHIPLLSAPVH